MRSLSKENLKIWNIHLMNLWRWPLSCNMRVHSREIGFIGSYFHSSPFHIIVTSNMSYWDKALRHSWLQGPVQGYSLLQSIPYGSGINYIWNSVEFPLNTERKTARESMLMDFFMEIIPNKCQTRSTVNDNVWHIFCFDKSSKRGKCAFQ